ncbi:hypothetical protein ACOMHN_007909 [Nucella lapillus]
MLGDELLQSGEVSLPTQRLPVKDQNMNPDSQCPIDITHSRQAYDDIDTVTGTSLQLYPTNRPSKTLHTDSVDK